MKFDKGVEVFNEEENTDTENIGIAVEKRTPFNEFAEEIKRTLRFYMKNNNQAFFNKFYITGGSASLPGIDNFISTTLNVKVELLDSTKNINNSIAVKNLNQYTVAIGLALRGLDI
jgi:type IV pilus assembly protein PilM